MIANLPKEFPIDALKSFDFGDAEAQEDSLLPSCPVPIAAVSELLAGRKDIILGYRGSGKSALVRLLVEGKISFQSDDGFKPIVLALNEEFSFQLIASALNRQASEPKDRKRVCRVIWEVLLIYRAMQSVSEHLQGDHALAEYLSELDQILGVPGKKGLIEILFSSKKKIGIKIDTNLPTVVDMYTSFEPATSPSVENTSAPTIRLIDYKKHLNQLLQKKKLKLFVLFDRLDDFVAQEEYDVQRHLLHGLLATQSDYRQRYQYIKVKAFIRSDLFRKLDLSDFGPDKILARSLSLTWSPADIKKFVAKRIALNLIRTLSLKVLQVEIDRDECLVTRDELALLQESKHSMRVGGLWRWKFWKSAWWLGTLGEDQREGRPRNFGEIVDERIITSILPTEVFHKKMDGSDASISLFKYFETHFQFGHGETTPRAMLSYMNSFLSKVRDYYSQNPDISSVKAMPNGEYPLFVKRAASAAYAEHRRSAWETQYAWATPWKPLVGTAQRISKKRRFTFDEFAKAANISNEEAGRFLAFIAHTGLVKCLNEGERTELREYEFPILFVSPKSPES